MANIIHLHASGRFDANADEVGVRLKYLAAQGANLITLTEVDFQSKAITDFAGTEWGVWHPQGDGKRENAILWKNTDFKVITKEANLLTNLHLRTGRNAPLYATTAVLKTNNNKRVLVSVTHLPAHLDASATITGSKTSNWPSTVHREATRGWHQALSHRKVDGKIVAADWNLDFKRPLVVGYAKLRFPRLKSGYVWKNIPVGEKTFGTHGTRFIDVSLSNLKRVKSSHVLPTSRGFDHRPVKTIYSI